MVQAGALATLACSQKQPPGAEQEHSVVSISLAPDAPLVEVARAGRGPEPGTLEDNLPFEPGGQKLASIAWRTWIYTDVGPKRTRYGTLRAGAIVDRRDPPIYNDACKGGWYRINPRGFVCVGKGATLELDHPVVVASQRRAERGEGLPFHYVLSDQRAPHLYFRLPRAKDMREIEGDYQARSVRWLEARRARDQLDLVGYRSEIPTFLSAGPLTKPYGTETGLRRTVHAGQASSDSGFALVYSIPWEGRVFGLTTELDLIPLDRTTVVQPSELRGVVLEADRDLPVAIVTDGALNYYELGPAGELKAAGLYTKRSVIDIDADKQRIGGVGYWRTNEGYLIPAAGVKVIERRNSFPSVATGSRKWIDVSINEQTLVAYTGQKAEFATLVSTGAGGLGDPEKVPSTIQGTFMIHDKHVTTTMDGDDDKSDSFNLQDVPFVQYFHKGYALHGTYWHDDFGRIRSHGCINLSPRDAAWLFEWTDPHVPSDWHSVLNKERGTVVTIHP